MKVDLDEVARLAGRLCYPLGVGPSTTLALVTRIRELEAQALRTIEATGLTVEDELETLRQLLEKGTVIA